MEPTASDEDAQTAPPEPRESPKPQSVADDVAIVGLVLDKGQRQELTNMRTVHKWGTHFSNLSSEPRKGAVGAGLPAAGGIRSRGG